LYSVVCVHSCMYPVTMHGAVIKVAASYMYVFVAIDMYIAVKK